MVSIGITGVREKIKNGAYEHKLKYPKKDLEKMKRVFEKKWKTFVKQKIKIKQKKDWLKQEHMLLFE